MQYSKDNFKDILKRYVDGIYTQADVKKIFDFTESDGNDLLLEKEMDRVWAEYAGDHTDKQYEQDKAEARQLLKQLTKPRKRFAFMPVLKYAAVFLILLSVGIGSYSYIQSRKNIIPEYTQIQVDNGERKQIVLPDGTHVVLNAGSMIQYPSSFDLSGRIVELNGEAFFDVEKNEKVPFIVRTTYADIKVLGTSFNIKAYREDEQLMVTVQSGKVQVDMPESMTRLIANEQLLLNIGSGDFQKKKEDIQRVKSWMNGGLYFDKTPIRSVVSELQRMYDCEILFDPRFVYDEYIYGEHDNKSLEAVLKSIQYSTDIRYRKEGESYTLYKIQ